MSTTAILDRKTISITGKRQITIPQKFFEALGFGKEAECELRDDGIVLRPKSDGENDMFSELILADLIDKGYSGKELLAAFKEAKSQIRPAVEAMIADAETAAQNPDQYASYEDIFGKEEE